MQNFRKSGEKIRNDQNLTLILKGYIDSQEKKYNDKNFTLGPRFCCRYPDRRAAKGVVILSMFTEEKNNYLKIFTENTIFLENIY